MSQNIYYNKLKFSIEKNIFLIYLNILKLNSKKFVN